MTGQEDWDRTTEADDLERTAKTGQPGKDNWAEKRGWPEHDSKESTTRQDNRIGLPGQDNRDWTTPPPCQDS
jgi:hypothetical protein